MKRFQIKFKLFALTLLALIVLTPLFVSTKLYAQISDNASSSNIRLVADEFTPIPNWKGNFTAFNLHRAPIVGEPLFYGYDGYGSSGHNGIYLFNRGRLLKVADTNTQIPGIEEKENFGSFSLFNNKIASLGDGKVVFVGRDQSYREGLYLFDNGRLSVIANKDTPMPGGTDTFSQFTNITSIGGNDILFRGLNGTHHQQGIYAYKDGRISLVVDKNTPIPGSGTLADFNDFVVLNDELDLGIHIIKQTLPQKSGIYLFIDGQYSLLVEDDSPIPDANYPKYFSDLKHLGGQNFMFRHVQQFSDGEQEGLLGFIDGELVVIANQNTLIPDGSGETLEDFTKHITTDIKQGNIAFTAGNEIYLYSVKYDTLEPISDGNFISAGRGTYPLILNNNIVFKAEVYYTGQNKEAFISYSLRDGTYSVIADRDTPIPGYSGNFSFFRLEVMEINGNEFIFSGWSGVSPNTNSGVYRAVITK
ncbi:MAG: hypothetical protein DHS20C13_00910 [Thermodesulfobacteriota bacterium]|nr:MAG: hypothetical protein DHS20C13_00910 [Thermodesulfobacteriota bacterium]